MHSTLDVLKQVAGGLIREMSSQEVANTLYGYAALPRTGTCDTCDAAMDPAGLRPEDPEELKEMQTKELQHCRLAMLAAAGMIVQELQTGSTLFYVSPSAPASADNILELKAQESIVRGQRGWSKQSSESSRPTSPKRRCGAR